MYPGAYRSQTTPFRVFKYFEKEKTRKIQYVEFQSRLFVRAKGTERQRGSTSPANSVALNPSRGQDFNPIKQSKFIGFLMPWKHATLINLKLRKLTIFTAFFIKYLYCTLYYLSLHVLSKSIPPVYVVQYQFQFWIRKGGLFGNFLSQFKLNKGDVVFSFFLFWMVLRGWRQLGASQGVKYDSNNSNYANCRIIRIMQIVEFNSRELFKKIVNFNFEWDRRIVVDFKQNVYDQVILVTVLVKQ